MEDWWVDAAAVRRGRFSFGWVGMVGHVGPIGLVILLVAVGAKVAAFTVVEDYL